VINVVEAGVPNEGASSAAPLQNASALFNATLTKVSFYS